MLDDRYLKKVWQLHSRGAILGQHLNFLAFQTKSSLNELAELLDTSYNYDDFKKALVALKERTLVSKQNATDKTAESASDSTTQESLVDLESIGHDVLDVSSDPIELNCKLDSPEFEKTFLEIMGTLLKRGFRSVASFTLAQYLKIDQRDLEAWADKNPKLLSKTDNCGAFFYELAKMPENEKFEIGTAEFERQLFVILNEGDKKWRSAEALAKALGVDQEKFVTWADKAPCLSRRVSEKDKNKVLYSASNPTEEKTKEPEKKTAEKKTETTKKVSKVPSSIGVAEYFALAVLNHLSNSLIKVMDQYANRLATRHEDAFAYLTKAQKALRQGVALLRADLKVPDEKLPHLEEI